VQQRRLQKEKNSYSIFVCSGKSGGVAPNLLGSTMASQVASGSEKKGKRLHFWKWLRNESSDLSGRKAKQSATF
jgi:hypothetical protein